MADANVQWLRKMGMGLLLAAVFIPLDLLAFMAVLGAGLYILLRTVRWGGNRSHGSSLLALIVVRIWLLAYRNLLAGKGKQGQHWTK
ncbi:hypothetical protein VTL71DRAFT_8168 [Oculimacula yallundae]|uniref:Uncharacterized protein n=1 Tax=Oculimacula yallundae TaxID=86028 RepID=A0ABR4CWY0_9HELO